MKFKSFLENSDIFGFDVKRKHTEPDDDMLSKPINQFNLELMMEFLSRKPVGFAEPTQPFLGEIIWGSQPDKSHITGAVKLEVDTGYSFYIKKLGYDKQGNPRWATKRIFQLNRQGYGGLEDSVAQEIYEHIVKIYEESPDGPSDNYEDLENLVTHIYNKLKRTSKNIFVPVGIKKLHENAYLICFEIRGHGLEAQDHRRVEQNQTAVVYDESQGTIRIFNYNIESPTGKSRNWQIMENDIDLYFFPSQSRDEISECLSVHMKYY